MKVPADRKVTICTYGLYGTFVDFYRPALSHLEDVDLIINNIGVFKDLFSDNLKNVHVFETDKSHAKMLLIEPNEVYLSSQNFTCDLDWFQHAVYIKDANAYQFYLNNVNNFKEKGWTGNIQKNTVGTWDKPANAPTGVINPDIQGITAHQVKGKYMGTVNWNQKFNNVENRNVIITTYTLPDMQYVRMMLDKLINIKHNVVTIYANSKVESKLYELCQEFSDFNYKTFSNMHAKMMLYNNLNYSGGTALLSSGNFGTSGWFENLILVKEKAYDYYKAKLEEFVNNAK